MRLIGLYAVSKMKVCRMYDIGMRNLDLTRCRPVGGDNTK